MYMYIYAYVCNIYIYIYIYIAYICICIFTFAKGWFELGWGEPCLLFGWRSCTKKEPRSSCKGPKP